VHIDVGGIDRWVAQRQKRDAPSVGKKINDRIGCLHMRGSQLLLIPRHGHMELDDQLLVDLWYAFHSDI
jgi:hypothetical protein